MYKIVLIFCYFIRFINCYDVTPISDERWPQPYYMHYCKESDSLYFTDYLTREIHRFDLINKRTYTATIENEIWTSFIIPVEGSRNRFVVCGDFTVFMIEWNGKDGVAKVVRDLITISPTQTKPVTFWGYAKISPNCEFYDGAFQENMCSNSTDIRNAALYHNDKPVFSNFKVSGAFDWNVEKNLFYHVDTCNGIIREFKWNPKTGNIDRERIAYKYENPENNDLITPHGMTIDDEGYLYVALYLGGEVLKIDPVTSKVVKRIKIPCTGVALLTFGGPNLDILFVTTQRAPFELSTLLDKTNNNEKIIDPCFISKNTKNLFYLGI